MKERSKKERSRGNDKVREKRRKREERKEAKMAGEHRENENE